MSAESPPLRIVIIGAVAAGTSAAAKARRNDETAEIVLYDRDRHISYSGCGLPYYIGGQVQDFGSLVPRDAGFFRKKYNVEVRVRHEVLSVDAGRKRLRVRNLEDGSEFEDRYDILVLATGAASVVPPIPGADRPHVFALRNPSDALAIRKYMDDRHPASAVVVGSGFIGMEMTESFVRAGLSVTVVEKLPRVCPFLDPDMSPYLADHLEKQGVALRTGRIATEILDSAVRLDDGSEVPGELVLLAVGIRPETSLARAMGIEMGTTGAIRVDERMRTSLPDVFACGDCAESVSIVDGRPVYRPLGSTANKMGRIAGDAMTGGSLAHRGIAGTGIFQVLDMAVAAAGLSEKEARDSGYDVVVSHNIKPDKPEYFGGREMVIKTLADRRTGRLLGVQIVGYEGVDKRMDVLVTAMTAGMTAEDLFHLDLAYAPPFSTTKDPVHYTGMILENAVHRGRDLLTAAEVDRRVAEGTLQVIDARVPGQFEKGHVDRAVNLPHDRIREAMAGLDPEVPVVTYCNKGVTGNAAQNILLNHGFREVYCLSGGYRQYRADRKGRRPSGQSD